MDTIFILNSHKQVIDVLSNNGSNPSAPFFDDTYKAELDTGAESYEFTTINNPRTNVTLEVGNYVLFKYNDKYKLFQIMETEDEHSEGKKLLTVYAEMAGMELLNDYCEPFSIEGNFIALLERALQDTNWRVGMYSASLLDNIQSVSYSEPKNVYSIIQENLATFGGVEIEFRVEFIGNQLAALLIDCYESGTRGNRKYRRFEYGKDVKGITRNRNINDLATAVIGQGNNNVTFKDIEWNKNLGNPCDKPLQQDFVVDIEANDLWNNGGKYIKTVHKVDTDDPQTLLQECWDYLQEIKQPKFDYDVDLALVAEDYQDIGIGDTNYVVDFDYQPAILLEARVGTLELSFADPRDNKCTLTNYKELVSILQQQPIDLNTVGNMIQSHFPIQGEDIAMGAIGEGHINVTYYQAIKTDIMNATLANVGTLIADKADIKDLTAINADIENLRANKADITDLNAANGNITNLTSQVAKIEDLIAGNATTGDLQTIHLTAANTTIDNALIKNAMIDTISANKINTGTLNTNKVNIQSQDGGIVLSGSTQQFKDKEGHVRVQIGKDAAGNFTFCLFSQDGVGILLDETGIKAGAVPDGLIVNDMVSDGANISGSKLDISSVITQINNNETTINSSHIKFDDTGQSLLVAFNQLKNTVDTIEEVTISGDLSSVIEKVNTHTTQIGVIQGQISSLIDNTTITKQDGTVVQLKDEYNATVDTVNSHTTKIGSLETNYNKVTGDIASVTSKQSTLEHDLSGFKTSVSETYTTKTEFNNLSIGGRNLAQKTSSEFSDPYTNFSGTTNTCVHIGKVLTDGLEVGDTVTVRLIYEYTDIVATTGQTAKCKIQGTGDVTSWSSGNFESSSWVTISGSGTYEFLYSFEITSDHLQNSSWRVEIRHDYVQSGSVRWKMFKVEKGNKSTDWTPAPEDVDKFTTDAILNSEANIRNNIDSAIEKAAEDTLANVEENYAPKKDYEEFKKSTASSIEQTSKDVSIKFDTVTESVQSVGGELKEFKETVSSNIKFSDEGIDISRTNSPFAVNINNEKMSFTDTGQEVAYISNREMRITDAVVENSLTLGNFKFIPWVTGNVSLIWDNLGNMINYDTSFANKTNPDYPTHTAWFREYPVEGQIYTIEFSGILASTANYWGLFNSGSYVHVLTLYPWETRNGVIKKSFVWKRQTSDGSHSADNSFINIYPMPEVNNRGNSTISAIKMYRGDDFWGGGTNLLKYNNLGFNGNTYNITASEDYFSSFTDIYAYLEKDVTYSFSCDVDCDTWKWDSSKDSVFGALQRRDMYANALASVDLTGNPCTFTVPTTDRYWLRLNVNRNGATHSFSNLTIKKV